MIKLHDQAKKPDFVAFAQLWSTFCTGELKIYLKTARHLESYFNVVEDRRKYGDSVLLNIQKVQRMKNLTQNVARSEAAGVVPYNPRPAPQELIRNNVFTVDTEDDTEDETETPAISSRKPLRPLAPLHLYLSTQALPILRLNLSALLYLLTTCICQARTKKKRKKNLKHVLHVRELTALARYRKKNV